MKMKELVRMPAPFGLCSERINIQKKRTFFEI